MKVNESKLGLISILSLSGQLTKGNLDELEKSFKNHLAMGNMRMLIDLKDVSLIDSAGLELLWDSLMKFRKVGGSLKLANPSSLISDILLATKMNNIFEIFSDQEKAYRSFL
ncbi:MAG: STAS domain-containing protein [bacterium]